MATTTSVQRKGPVLNRPALPCLSNWHTINLLAGCPYGCRYCYARSFRSNPGDGRVHFYANTLDALRRELPRKRVPPHVVYLSTACEPFVPVREVLDVLHGVIALLLENGVSILVSTKSAIPERFLSLFAGFPRQVFIQVGLTTCDDDIRRILEPHAAGVPERLDTLAALVGRGIPAEARMDPLIPELTDGDDSFEALCRCIADCGVKTSAASHLFLRRAVSAGMRLRIEQWSFRDMARRIYSHSIENYCGHNTIQVPNAAYREERITSLKRIAKSHGIALRACRCKNPDITNDCCHPTFSEPTESQLTLNWG